MALAQTEEEQVRALNKFSQLILTLEATSGKTPTGESFKKDARAPKSAKAWRDYEATLDKETKRELGTTEDFEKQQIRDKKLFRGKVLSVSAGLILGILASVVFGGSDA